jgi:hypothetical protein
MFASIERLVGANQQTMVFSCIASRKRGAAIGPCPIGMQNLSLNGIFKINKLGFIKR